MMLSPSPQEILKDFLDFKIAVQKPRKLQNTLGAMFCSTVHNTDNFSFVTTL